MAIRAKEDTIVESTCLRAAQQALGYNISELWGFPYRFAVNAAELARDLYISRNDIEYILKYNCDERKHTATTVWAATLLSRACYHGDLSYDKVAELTNPEVADYLPFIQPNKTLTLFKGTSRMMSELTRCNSAHDYGPIFSVLGTALQSIKTWGTDTDAIQAKMTNASSAAHVWSVQYIIENMSKANIGRWSDYVADVLAEAEKAVKPWSQLENFPTVVFRFSVDWKLDMSVPSSACPKLYDESL